MNSQSLKIEIDTIPSSGFGLAEELNGVTSSWHQHQKHQLLYAASGTLRLHIHNKQWLLPPQRGAWLAAGIQHQVIVKGEAQLRTVYLSNNLKLSPNIGCGVFSISPLAREMILYAMRWPATREPADITANLFFRTLAALCCEWTEQIEPYYLPVAKTTELKIAMEYALNNLSTATLDNAAKTANISPRTLTRRFATETQITWRQFLHQVKMIAAMEMLAVSGSSVTITAFDVGFESLSAFTKAFKLFTGQTPREYQIHLFKPTS